ncbi:MAG: TonB-dependent receptor plug domain-containing protein [Candidatus Omnitrophota bacterium]
MKAKLIIANISFIALFYAAGFAEDTFTLEKITVKRFEGIYSQEVLTAEDLKKQNLSTPVDVLNCISGVDLRSRAPFGIQGDTSLRGSSYEQVAVLVDGIKLMDPQTGHYNLDIPLTIFDLERVEVTKEAASSLYGAGALAGSINLVIKKPQKQALNLESFFGEHALFGQAFSFSLPLKDFAARISFDQKKAKAARPNTDFDYQTGSFYLTKDSDSLSIDTLLGWQKKDYGADSFYSNLFPEEEEHTETLFMKSRLDVKLDKFILKNNLFLRKHDDKFILRRNNPTSANYHTNYIYGLDSSANYPFRLGNLTLGISSGVDQINSTNLGKHSRLYEAGILGLNIDSGNKVAADLRYRLDHYQKWASQQSFNLGLMVRLIDDKLKFRSSVGKSFRIPTFTDLYYSDAGNKGNQNLGVEKAYSYICGLDYKINSLDLGIEGFFRRGINLIDWTRTSLSVPWEATNLGRVDFKGGTFNTKVSPDFTYKFLRLDNVSFSYTYTDADKKSSGFFSKYAYDILMHQLILGVNSRVFGLGLDWQLTYSKRYYGEDYFVGNFYIGKKFSNKDYILEPFFKIDNFTNTEYSETSGVLQPGRWMQAGIKLVW